MTENKKKYAQCKENNISLIAYVSVVGEYLSLKAFISFISIDQI